MEVEEVEISEGSINSLVLVRIPELVMHLESPCIKEEVLTKFKNKQTTKKPVEGEWEGSDMVSLTGKLLNDEKGIEWVLRQMVILHCSTYFHWQLPRVSHWNKGQGKAEDSTGTMVYCPFNCITRGFAWGYTGNFNHPSLCSAYAFYLSYSCL